MIPNYPFISIRNNHKFLTTAGFIRQICAPLQHIKIHMFTYLKNFQDGTQLNLSTHAQWIKDYYELGLYHSSLFQASPIIFNTGFKWWPTESPLAIFQHGREHFDSYYGLTYCRPQTDSCEFFFFSTSAKNYQHLEFYWNNLDLLEKFITYFLEQAAPIIKSCHSSRLLLPPELIPLFSSSQLTSNPVEGPDERTAFLQAIQPQKTSLALTKWLQAFEPLTSRERTCLEFLLQEPTVARIADRMGISKRTAETYMENLKTKLNCHTKQTLVMKLSDFYHHTT